MVGRAANTCASVMPLLAIDRTRSRIIVTMLRYEATSAVSDNRPVTGNHPGSPLGPVLGNGQIEDAVQSVDHALNGSAVFEVDPRKCTVEKMSPA